ncbi:MAG: hypothetical protein CL803_13755 [Citromicrobium sp.]|nr:hypothetical protein AAJ72_01920 [Citromicrobium sp. RCC1885]KPM27781.1 hypothetical protein AAJ74_02665 [Citromicrobium sp. RCC1878]MAO02983.1 hypothetical protein [Citromicrobium sp.]MAO97403.1 hypothetical protein [Citromicrobium sp.]OAM10722.1 hypothetical protein A0U43_06745 [Citromicrobium sp. RCC1897]
MLPVSMTRNPASIYQFLPCLWVRQLSQLWYPVDRTLRGAFFNSSQSFLNVSFPLIGIRS